jgi:hypothetical protein
MIKQTLEMMMTLRRTASVEMKNKRRIQTMKKMRIKLIIHFKSMCPPCRHSKMLIEKMLQVKKIMYQMQSKKVMSNV